MYRHGIIGATYADICERLPKLVPLEYLGSHALLIASKPLDGYMFFFLVQPWCGNWGFRQEEKQCDAVNTRREPGD